MDAPVAILFPALPGAKHERATTKLCETNQLPHFSTVLLARKMYIESMSNSPSERHSPRSKEHATELTNFIQRKTKDDQNFFTRKIRRELPPGLVLITVYSDEERAFFMNRLDHVIVDGPVVGGVQVYDPDTYELFTENILYMVQSSLFTPDSFMPVCCPLYADSQDPVNQTPCELINATCH